MEDGVKIIRFRVVTVNFCYTKPLSVDRSDTEVTFVDY